VVQALTEWMLVLRVKKQNAMTRYTAELLLPDTCNRDGFARW
jgi:hypothetical protein